MLSKVCSYALKGIDGYKVDIEVDLTRGVPNVDTVGLPDTAVKESRDRVRSAIQNSGFIFPLKRITINLAPADTKKEGAYFDLSIAGGILAASRQITTTNYKDYIMIGELSLDGSLRGLNGILPLLLAGRSDGHTKYIIPFENKEEASYISGLTVYAFKTLKQTVQFLNGEVEEEPVEYKEYRPLERECFPVDFSEVKGQAVAKRGMEIAVAGGHNIIMVGPQGSGKTMLAKATVSIMPPLTFEEATEISKIHSVAGELDAKKGIVATRPIRTPHHTASAIALTGGGIKSKPGEISLAHCGILFLDEIPEYKRPVLESLRQPLEDGVITVARAYQTITYPARFMLLASMNPCPCGNFGSKKHECNCTPKQIISYQNKLSGPLLDRIDIKMQVDSISYEEYRDVVPQEPSSLIRNRVAKAREIQVKRFASDGIRYNAEMSARQIKKYCKIDNKCEELLEMAFNRLKLSARGVTRILKVARTIADLADSEDIKLEHLSEAIQFRSLDIKRISYE